MTEDFSVLAIVALLPLTACLLVTQVNPYHALVIRGILGAVAALVYALLGAADVALTEALVGTMLSITLYAVAVRSSLSMRLGLLENESDAPPLDPLLSTLRQTLGRYHLRLELATYPTPQALQTALMAREVHSTCLLSAEAGQSPYHLQTRVQRLSEILQADLCPTVASLTYVKPASLDRPEGGMPDSREGYP